MDERMEQILGVCNGLLARHPGAAAHHLQARYPAAYLTYLVFILIVAHVLCVPKLKVPRGN